MTPRIQTINPNPVTIGLIGTKYGPFLPQADLDNTSIERVAQNLSRILRKPDFTYYGHCRYRLNVGDLKIRQRNYYGLSNHPIIAVSRFLIRKHYPVSRNVDE